MMEQTLHVQSLKGDAAVLLADKQQCGSCEAEGACGSLARMFSWGRTQQHTYSVDNLLNVEVGQRVVVAMDERAFIFAAALTYMVPILVMLLFAVLGQYWHGELAGIALAFFGFFSSLFLLRLTFKQPLINALLRPTMLRLADPSVHFAGFVAKV